MDEQYIAKITDEETDDYSWMQRAEPQWKGLVYKELFQRFLLTYPFAVLTTPIFQHGKYNPIVPVIHGCGSVPMRDNDGKLIECDIKEQAEQMRIEYIKFWKD